MVGTANEQWLNAVYEIELNRDTTQSELQIWDQQFADGRTRQSIALAIANSPEGKQTSCRMPSSNTLADPPAQPK